jgi:long-chain alkane monooxygenase
LEDWIAAGVDGFNVAYATVPGTFEDFIDGVVPVLQRRGRMQTSYRPGTLREKLFEDRAPLDVGE